MNSYPLSLSDYLHEPRLYPAQYSVTQWPKTPIISYHLFLHDFFFCVFQAEASKLIQRLQRLDNRFSRYLNLVLKSAMSSKASRLSDELLRNDGFVQRHSAPAASTNAVQPLELLHQAKRQSSSGANNIC